MINSVRYPVICRVTSRFYTLVLVLHYPRKTDNGQWTGVLYSAERITYCAMYILQVIGECLLLAQSRKIIIPPESKYQEMNSVTSVSAVISEFNSTSINPESKSGNSPIITTPEFSVIHGYLAPVLLYFSVI